MFFFSSSRLLFDVNRTIVIIAIVSFQKKISRGQEGNKKYISPNAENLLSGHKSK